MPDQLQLRGGTTTEHNSFTGALREVTVDTTKKTLVVHDGATAGGTALMRESGGNAASTVGIGVGGANKITINADGHVDIASNLDCAAGIDVTGAIAGTGDLTIDTNTLHVDSSNNRVGIGTTSPTDKLHVVGDVEFTLGTNLFDVMTTGSGTKYPIRLLNADASAGNKVGIEFGAANNVICSRIAGIAENDFTSAANRDGGITFESRLNGTLSEAMRIDSSGRVGIGTTSPSNFLEIEGGSTTTTQIVVDGTGRYRGLEINENGTRKAYFHHDATDNKAQLNTAEGILSFATGDTERMRIDSSGNVGIGKSSDIHEKLNILDASQPTNSRSGGLLLQCSATSGADVGVPIAWRNQIGNGTEAQTYGIAAICGRKENGDYNFDTSSTKGYLQFCTTNSGGAERMRIDSSGRLLLGVTSASHASANADDLCIGSNTSSTERGLTFGSTLAATIRWADAEQSAAGIIEYVHTDNRMTFTTNNAERMRIDSSGNTFINCTSDPLSQNAKFAVQHGGDGQSVAVFDFNQNFSRPNMFIKHARAGAVSGTKVAKMIAFLNLSGTEVGTIQSGLAGTSFNTSSDYRLKENITNISDGITRIKQLIPKKFNFIGDGDKTLKDGFLAHEVSSVVPEAITGTKDEVDENNEPVYQGIDQSKLVPLLVAAVQELIGKVEALEAA